MKWLFALVIFVLGMTFTWSDVGGTELSPVLKIHKNHTAHFNYAGSRYRPNWFPGFLKPKKTILASVTPILNDTDHQQNTNMVMSSHSDTPTSFRMNLSGQS
jgi:hypothetical protein